MKREPIFNLYFIIEGGVIRGRAAVCHERSGTDEQKLGYLDLRCHVDAANAKRYPVPKGWMFVDENGKQSPGLSWESYQTTLSQVYGDVRWFEDIFQAFGAPQNPLMVITCIVDGKVVIEGERAVK